MPEAVSNIEVQNQARLALHLAAKEAAEVVKAALITNDTKENYEDKANASVYATGEKRIALALEILKIAWMPK